MLGKKRKTNAIYIKHFPLVSDWLTGEDMGESPSEMSASLLFEDQNHRDGTLERLNTLRKGGRFCDVILEVDGSEIPAHRAVLASASVYLFELFNVEEEKSTAVQHVQLENWDLDSFLKLVNYAYTSKLEVPADQVRAVYRTAMMLKMNGAAKACSQFLAKHLLPSNCLGIRSFANSYSDTELTNITDEYIQEYIDAVFDSPETKTIPFMEMDIIGVDDSALTFEREKHLCKMVVEWIETALMDDTLEELSQRPHVLVLTADNVLKDCSELEGEEVLTSDDKVQDYRRYRRKRGSGNKQRAGNEKASRSPPYNQANPPYGGRSMDRLSSIDKEFKFIAVKQVAERCCMCLAMLDDTVSRLSLNLRPMPQTNGGTSNGVPSPNDSPRSSVSGDKQCSLTPLATMSSARCGFGTVVLNNKLIALGGYDRGECMNSVEWYDIATNTWESLPPMLSARGRFSVAEHDGKLYACGGSDGSDELYGAEYYDSVRGKWQKIPNMKTPRSSAGVATLNGQLYVIGGWTGQSGITQCDMYDPISQEWTLTAKLNTGRTQAAVCVVKGQMFVFGGSDNWNCMNSVEVYNPSINKWSYMPSLSVCRRGAGAAFFKNKLYVVGGSDGTSALSSVEIFDLESRSWSFGPNLSIPRANVGVAVYSGRLFAVGGFSGKDFLNTMEYLTEDGHEWCGFQPVSDDIVE